jgi:DNA-binding response OmpR family regulator
MPQPHILVVDDDHIVRETVKHVLLESGYQISEATNGLGALESIARTRPDLILLDVMMPDLDGFEVCRRLRADPYSAKLPIIFLTSKDRPTDVANGLNAGGDDFVSKAAIRIELPARIHALLRRIPGGSLDLESDHVVHGELQLHTVLLEAQVGERRVELTPVEHHLLHYLLKHAGQPIATDQLLQDVWGYHPGTGDPKLVRVTIARLRAKIEPHPENPQYLLNIRGRGYLIKD